MSANFHPGEDLLVAYAAGTLGEEVSVVIATHLALCPECREGVARLEDVGGALMEDLPPVNMRAGALETILSRLDEVEREKPRQRREAASLSPQERIFPEPLRSRILKPLHELPWTRLSTGVRQVKLAGNRNGARLRLFRIAPGTALPRHGHQGLELTLVLTGGFADSSGHYLRGDVARRDGDDIHQPIADSSEECICVAVTEAPLKLEGVVGRLVQSILRF